MVYKVRILFTTVSIWIGDFATKSEALEWIEEFNQPHLNYDIVCDSECPKNDSPPWC